MGGKKTRFLLFAFRYVRARVYRCILSFLSSPLPAPEIPDADRSGSLGTNIVIYTSGKPGGANNGMNVSSPRGGKCKNVSFYPRRVESKFGRVVFSAKKKNLWAHAVNRITTAGGKKKTKITEQWNKCVVDLPDFIHCECLPARSVTPLRFLFLAGLLLAVASTAGVAAATSSESLRISRTRLSPKQYNNNNNNNIGCLYYVLLLLFYCSSYRAGVQISLNRIWNLFIRIDRLQL